MEKAYELNNEEVANTDIDTVSIDMFAGTGFFDDEKKEDEKIETQKTVQSNKKTTKTPKDEVKEPRKGNRTRAQGKTSKQKEVKSAKIKEETEKLNEEQLAEQLAKGVRQQLYASILEELETWPNIHFQKLEVSSYNIISADVSVEEKYIAMGGRYNDGNGFSRIAHLNFRDMDLKKAKTEYLKVVDKVIMKDMDRWERTKEQFETEKDSVQYKGRDDREIYRNIYGKLSMEDCERSRNILDERNRKKNKQQKQAS
ncbi:hypothetical protein P4679_22535 [Priestia megaterium]|uniref:hypothetical protein n=1 Tax=Priestia megaterium TaxID=1404 RepID=UPI002E1BA9BD|nr:hypothetical protein [Priestia megaterium]